MEQLGQTQSTPHRIKTERYMANNTARTIMKVLEHLSIGTLDTTNKLIVEEKDVEKICLINREDAPFRRECASPPCRLCLGVIKQTGVKEVTVVDHNQIHKKAILALATELGRELRGFEIKTAYRSVVGEMYYTDCSGNKCDNY